ncbi:MAG: hypothetical protein JO091_10935, partial [Acidobacteriaceae bacterium]|nr:hypothetical protein [Acidobacteriaceae bacterium]
DRISPGAVRPHSFGCVEFEPGSGLWCVARFAHAEAEAKWSDRVKGCFRLLADTGFGARRTSGWGQAEAPQFQSGSWPNLLFPKIAGMLRNGDSRLESSEEPPLYWLLSLYSPASVDAIDWSGGDYRLAVRGGRIESPARGAEKKKAVQMIVEGSVLATRAEPVGTAVDVAPDGFAHAVYRCGFAVAVPLPVISSPDLQPIEAAAELEIPEARPCLELEPSPFVEIGIETPEQEQEEPVHEI